MEEEPAKKRRTNKSHIKVRGQLDGTGRMLEGSLTIDPILGIATVRTKGKHVTYTKSLSDIADWICRSNLIGKRAG